MMFTLSGILFSKEDKNKYLFNKKKLRMVFFPYQSENAKDYPAKDLKDFSISIHGAFFQKNSVKKQVYYLTNC